MTARCTPPDRQTLIRALFDDYMKMYATRDARLTERFSENFSGYAGGGHRLIKDRDEWARITRQDFAQVHGHLRIEMLDLALQDLCADVVVATAFFHIHLSLSDLLLSRETARLVLIFRREGDDWKIAHSGISIPFHLVEGDEVYPLRGLRRRNDELEKLIGERTRELEEANFRLKVLSNTDGLTGIGNRRSFDLLLAQEWHRAQRAAQPIALIMLDVDHFKHFNDHYGHLAGDDCLRALAGALRGEIRRSGELVARYGGEEFVVLIPDARPGAALDAARRIQRSVWSLAIEHSGVAAGIVTFSLGVACLTPQRQQTAEALIQGADAALYRAKLLGRNQLQMAGNDDAGGSLRQPTAPASREPRDGVAG